jgi:hypothetical protein
MERSVNRTIQTASSAIEVLKNASKMPSLTFQDGYEGSQDLRKVSEQSKDTRIVKQEDVEGRLIGVKKPKSISEYGLETIFHAIRPQIAFKKKWTRKLKR